MKGHKTIIKRKGGEKMQYVSNLILLHPMPAEDFCTTAKLLAKSLYDKPMFLYTQKFKLQILSFHLKYLGFRDSFMNLVCPILE